MKKKESHTKWLYPWDEDKTFKRRHSLGKLQAAH